MKNKNFKYLSLIVLMMIINLSCDNLLDIQPQGSLVKDEFWRSKDHAVAAIAGIYAYTGSSSYNFGSGNLSATAISPVESYIYWGEIRGELLNSNSGRLSADQVEKENVDNLSVTPADVTTKYTQFYKIINLANLAIKYIPEIKKTDPSFTADSETNLIGEAYFLRAFAYYWMTRAFGEVPLTLEPSETDLQNYDVPKSSTEELYSQIESDLITALDMLPDWYDNNQYAHCRATKNTARTVLAEVYLTMASLSLGDLDENGYYDQAISLCDEVTGSYRYTLVPGSSYGSLFSSGATSESIFETYGNKQLNNQTNRLREWFYAKGYFVVPSVAEALFSETIVADYRSATPPTGPSPLAGAPVTYNFSTRYVLKYSSSTSDARWIFYRLPDILFMKAEAIAHRYVDDLNKLQEACALVNQVRFRAYGIDNYPQVSATTTYGMDNILLSERGREFLGEGKRWFELVRFASRNNFAHKELLVNRVVESYNGTDRLLIGPRLQNPESWYLPINSGALDASPSLIQNPFYQ